MSPVPELLNIRRNAYTTPNIDADLRLRFFSPITRSKIAKIALELYTKSRDIVAPVFTGFADHLLYEAAERQVVCIARDGLALYIAAKNLKERFDYPNKDSNQLRYAYLSRRVVKGTDHATLAAYMLQIGIKQEDNVILADLGWTGSRLPKIKEVIPNADMRYLISFTPNISGYAHGVQNQMIAFENTIRNIDRGLPIPSNPPVFFLEDTFSGPIESPTALIERDERLIPDTLDTTYPTEIAIKRDYALLGVQDYIRVLDNPPKQPCQEAIRTLDDFLSDPSQYANLMVPHE